MSNNNLYVLDLETECNMGCTSACDHALIPHQARITVVGIYGRHTSGTPTRQVFRDLNQLVLWLDNNSSAEFAGHNFKFDLKHLRHAGITIALSRWAHDTSLMAYVFSQKVPDDYLADYEKRRKEENKKLPRGYSHRLAKGGSLKVLAPYFLGVEPFWENPADHNNDEYVLKDCQYTFELYEFFSKKMTSAEMGFYKKYQLPWAKELLLAEFEGVLIDQGAMAELEAAAKKAAAIAQSGLESAWKEASASYLQTQKDLVEREYHDMTAAAIARLKDPSDEKILKTKSRYEELKLAALKKVDQEINLQSPSQILWVLKDYFQLDTRKADGEEYSTGKEVLSRLVRDGRSDAKLLLEFKKAAKRRNSYFPTYKELLHANRISCSFNPTGTRTGRISSSGPNLQQVPPDLRKIFIADDGYCFITRDLSSLEPTLIAYYSNDQRLCELILEGRDFHSTNAQFVFNLDCSVDEVKARFPDHRAAAKEFGLSVLYGAGKNTVKKSLLKRGFSFSEEDCKKFVYRLRDLYSGVWEFKLEVDKALIARETLFNYMGRPIYFENQEDVYMKGFNKLIQGSGSDIVQESGRNIREDGVARSVLLIHDELVLKAKKENEAAATKSAEYHMTKWKMPTPHGELKFKVEGANDVYWRK